MSDAFANLNFGDHGAFTPGFIAGANVSGTPTFNCIFARNGAKVDLWGVITGLSSDVASTASLFTLNTLPFPTNQIDGAIAGVMSYFEVGVEDTIIRGDVLIDAGDGDKINMDFFPTFAGNFTVNWVATYLTEV